MTDRFSTAAWIRDCVSRTKMTKAKFADAAGISRHRFWGIFWGLVQMTEDECELFTIAYCRLAQDGSAMGKAEHLPGDLKEQDER